jgi:hypothetical protein
MIFSPCLSIHSFTRSTVSDPSRVADQLATMFRSTLSRTGAMLTPWLWTQIYRNFSMVKFVMEKQKKKKKKTLHQFYPTTYTLPHSSIRGLRLIASLVSIGSTCPLLSLRKNDTNRSVFF